MIPVQMKQGDRSVSTTVMVDSGASGTGYINKSFALQEHLALRRLTRPIRIYGFDGEEIAHGRITHVAHVKMHYLNHTEKIRLYVTTLGKHAAILGLPWMKKHGAVPDWDAQIIRFTDPRCPQEHATNPLRKGGHGPRPEHRPGPTAPLYVGRSGNTQTWEKPEHPTDQRGPAKQALPSRPPSDTKPAQRKERKPLPIRRRYDDWKYAFERSLKPEQDSKPAPDSACEPELDTDPD